MFIKPGQTIVSPDCGMTIHCYGGNSTGGVDYHCALNEECVAVNGEGTCLKGKVVV